ncbi:MAG: methylmalonyl Co-A mutase-associated GTPase MeaB [Thermomicrobiales bacterium]
MTLLERFGSGDPRALPRLLTLIENRDPAGIAALDVLYPRGGNAHIVGITGPPGSGKSTLVAALVSAIRASSRSVAVLAIDPSSPVTGGAVLGDRIRMMDLHADPGVFIRSMASRGRVGGLAPAAAGAVAALDAAGFPIILVETVGTGQDGIDIVTLAQTVIVVQVPGLGDGVQAIKAGQLEVGDLLVVNKADLAGSAELVRLLRQSAEDLGTEGWDVPVLPVTATSGEGISQVLETIDRHRAYLVESREGVRRSVAAANAAVMSGLRAAIERRISAGQSEAVTAMLAQVAGRERSPDSAVAALLALLDASPRGGDPVGDQRGG